MSDPARAVANHVLPFGISASDILRLPYDFESSIAPQRSVLVLSAAEIATLHLDLEDVVPAVEGSIVALAPGEIDVAPKIGGRFEPNGSQAHAMIGTHRGLGLFGFKTTYKRFVQQERGSAKYYTTLTLFDDRNGDAVAMLDCERIGGTRTSVVTALLANVARPAAGGIVTVLGTGVQGRATAMLLPAVSPWVREIFICGAHVDNFHPMLEIARNLNPACRYIITQDVEAAVKRSQVVIAASGPQSRTRVPASWIAPGTACVSVGFGFHPDVLERADYRLATSAAQMRVTGKHLQSGSYELPALHAELSEVLRGTKPARSSPEDIVFAYNSGLIVTDIAVAALVLRESRRRQIGHLTSMW